MSELKITGLVKRFGGLTATDHLNLHVRTGEVHALIGPNGAGKTTLITQIAGTLSPNSGAIQFDGADVTRLPCHERVRLGLARSYQITSIFLHDFTVLENILLAVQQRRGSSFRFWHPVRKERELLEEARTIVADIGLAKRENSLAATLAHGEQRQLELGLALATQPKLVLMDEPMAGMSGDESMQVVHLIERLKGRITILLVEHDMDAVFRLADRISVLVYGKVIATGTPDEIRVNPDVRKAYLGDEVAA
jgi:branched-chain amino acid transport system ATP-binding protein